jgi:hypothetical protein
MAAGDDRLRHRPFPHDDLRESPGPVRQLAESPPHSSPQSAPEHHYAAHRGQCRHVDRPGRVRPYRFARDAEADARPLRHGGAEQPGVVQAAKQGHGWTDPLSIIFARGADQDTAIEQEVLRAIGENESDAQYLDVRFEPRTQVEPLQAADVAVYDMCKEVARILGHHQRERRKLMARLEERDKHWGYMDEEELTRFMEKNAHLLAGPLPEKRRQLEPQVLDRARHD